MKKILSALTLAAAGLTSQSTALAAAEDWKDDPTVVFHEVDHKSCTKPDKGTAHTMTLTVEVIAVKDSWDKVMAGKTPAQQKALTQKMLDTAVKSLNEDFSPRMRDFTQEDIEAAYELAREDYGRDPYRAAIRNSFEKAIRDVRDATGIDTMMGVDAYPEFSKGCKLKP